VDTGSRQENASKQRSGGSPGIPSAGSAPTERRSPNSKSSPPGGELREKGMVGRTFRQDGSGGL